MKLLSTLAVGALLAGASFANNGPAKKTQGGDAPKTWSLNVAFNLPQGDHEDAGFDNMFTIGADYMLGMAAQGTNASSYIGVLYTFGSGDFDTDSRTYGVHYGMMFGLGTPGTDNPFNLNLKLGYYNTELSNGSSEDRWGLGGSVGFVWRPTNQTGGNNWGIEAGWYFYPEVMDVDNNGFFIGVRFAVGG